jgi:uncharacterized Zn-binding protein involved in type VI secretion
MQTRYSNATIGRAAGTPAELARKRDPLPPIPASLPGGGAGRPAARLGDMTVHGGVITTASADVVIGGRPAARVADMHVCPVADVGGPILPAGSATVLINFRSAAHLGDQCSCTGSPDVIAGGEYTVLIG